MLSAMHFHGLHTQRERESTLDIIELSANWNSKSSGASAIRVNA